MLSVANDKQVGVRILPSHFLARIDRFHLYHNAQIITWDYDEMLKYNPVKTSKNIYKTHVSNFCGKSESSLRFVRDRFEHTRNPNWVTTIGGTDGVGNAIIVADVSRDITIYQEN